MWTPDRTERLKALWAEGKSSSQIAKELGGLTRNAVIGKVKRLIADGEIKPNEIQKGHRYMSASEADKIAGIREVRSCTEQEAREFLAGYDLGRDVGRREGQKEAQRFFRVAFGLEVPTDSERAYWNNPVPTKEST